MANNEDIIRKVKGLLRRSEELNDDEGQNAFLLAQKLMIKNGIERDEILNEPDSDNIVERPVTNYKKLYWWERELAQIIAKNFKVKNFYSGKAIDSYTYRRIVFYGFSEDVELANEMWVLAYEVLQFWTNKYIDISKENEIYMSKSNLSELRRSYKKGFLDGLDSKFTNQIYDLKGKYELIELIPKEVEDAYDEYSSDFETLEMPKVEVAISAYEDGRHDGNEIDLTQSTVSTTESFVMIGEKNE